MLTASLAEGLLPGMRAWTARGGRSLVGVGLRRGVGLGLGGVGEGLLVVGRGEGLLGPRVARRIWKVGGKWCEVVVLGEGGCWVGSVLCHVWRLGRRVGRGLYVVECACLEEGCLGGVGLEGGFSVLGLGLDRW